MKIDDDFRRLLHTMSVEIMLSLRDEEVQYKDQAVFDARKTGNPAAVALAYSEAILRIFENRARLTIERYMSALENCGIDIDDEVEKEMLREISRVVSISPNLKFPPTIRREQAASIQSAHDNAMGRLSHQLYKEAANRLWEEKIKARARAEEESRLLRVLTEIKAPERTITPAAVPPESAVEHNRIHLERVSARREARKKKTRAMYKSWQKEYRSLKTSRPNRSDVWYAQHIAKDQIAQGRSAETIRKHMER
jgi:hypothetical protein